jgi:hypothetical protein
LSDYLKNHSSEQAIEQKNQLVLQLNSQVAELKESENKLNEA